MKTCDPRPYFPKGLFGDERSDSIYAPGIESILARVDEKSLYQRDEKSPVQVYRFTWVRSFHPAVVIALKLEPHFKAHLAVWLLKKNHLIPQFFHVENREKLIDDESVDTLIQAFRRVEFLKIPANKERGTTIIIDGATWIIEAAESGIYHAVYRCSPYKEQLWELGLEFIRLAGLGDEEIY